MHVTDFHNVFMRNQFAIYRKTHRLTNIYAISLGIVPSPPRQDQLAEISRCIVAYNFDIWSIVVWSGQYVEVDLGNGLMQLGINPLSEPMLTEVTCCDIYSVIITFKISYISYIYVWTVLANETRHYICTVFSHWLGPFSHGLTW